MANESKNVQSKKRGGGRGARSDEADCGEIRRGTAAGKVLVELKKMARLLKQCLGRQGLGMEKCGDWD
jgi:hypothetical protein